jgi:hypothetical protein
MAKTDKIYYVGYRFDGELRIVSTSRAGLARYFKVHSVTIKRWLSISDPYVTSDYAIFTANFDVIGGRGGGGFG